MKRFRFNLESVLRLRLQEEQSVQSELAEALRAHARAQDVLDRSRRAESDLYEYLQGGGLTAADLRHVHRYLELHRQKIVDAVVEVKFAGDDVERVRVRLVDAQVRRQALEKLRDRQQAAHTAVGLSIEQRDIDEIASVRAHRRSKGEMAGHAAGWGATA